MQAADGQEEARRDGQEGSEEAKETAAGDYWPSASDQPADLLVELDRIARLRLAWLEPDPLRRDRIVDRAMDRLLGRVLLGDPPKRARAWFRQVVDRLIQFGEIPYGRRHVPLERIGDMGLAEESADGERQRRLHAETAWLRENRINFGLSDWEQAVLGAALEHRSNRAAAKSLGMSAWNFRRALGRLGRKIRREWALKGEENFPRSEPPPPLKGRARLCCRATEPGHLIFRVSRLLSEQYKIDK